MTIIVGHRGAAGHAPENTLESFRAAIDLGCPKTECDVHLSADGRAIVIHDESLDKTTNGKGPVRDLTFTEIRKFRCANGEQVPSLQEVIDITKGKIHLLIELKAPGTPKAVNDHIEKNKIENEVTILSFYEDLLFETKKLNPELKINFLIDKKTDKRPLQEKWKIIDELQPDYIGLKEKNITSSLLDRAHRKGMKVYCYFKGKKKLGDRLIQMGVDELCANNPETFL